MIEIYAGLIREIYVNWALKIDSQGKAYLVDQGNPETSQQFPIAGGARVFNGCTLRKIQKATNGGNGQASGKSSATTSGAGSTSGSGSNATPGCDQADDSDCQSDIPEDVRGKISVSASDEDENFKQIQPGAGKDLTSYNQSVNAVGKAFEDHMKSEAGKSDQTSYAFPADADNKVKFRKDEHVDESFPEMVCFLLPFRDCFPGGSRPSPGFPISQEFRE